MKFQKPLSFKCEGVSVFITRLIQEFIYNQVVMLQKRIRSKSRGK